jgi:hypothetical protein
MIRFKECKKQCRDLYNARRHQPNTTGKLNETKPMYFTTFYHYFDYLQTFDKLKRTTIKSINHLLVNMQLFL